MLASAGTLGCFHAFMLTPAPCNMRPKWMRRLVMAVPWTGRTLRYAEQQAVSSTLKKISRRYDPRDASAGIAVLLSSRLSLPIQQLLQLGVYLGNHERFGAVQ